LALKLIKIFPNCCISFNGIITFSKSSFLRELAFDIPLNRILISSDSPRFPPPQAPPVINSTHNGGKNSGKNGGKSGKSKRDKVICLPSYIPLIAREIGKQKKMSEHDILVATVNNAAQFYHIKLNAEQA